MTDKARFDLAKASLDDPHERFNIGTYKERSQHLVLKRFYESDISCHETVVGGYVADILNEKGITEIQTAAFRSLYDKLAVFLPSQRVTVVFPVGKRKRVCWVDTEIGEASYGKYCTYPREKYKLLSELLSIVDYFGESNLEIHAVEMEVTVKKALDGYGADRKKRATKLDTVPDSLIGTDVIRNAEDVRKILPFKTGERLNTKDISERLGLKRIPLWRAIKFLTITEIITKADKVGNGIIYEVLPECVE